MDVNGEIVDTLKQFIQQINSLDVKLSFFNDVKQDEDKDISDDDVLEDNIHEDRMTT